MSTEKKKRVKNHALTVSGRGGGDGGRGATKKKSAAIVPKPLTSIPTSIPPGPSSPTSHRN